MNNNKGNSNMPPSYSPSDGSASSPVSQQQTRRTAGSRARRNHQQNLQHHSQQNQPLDQTRVNQTRLNQTRVEPASILPTREDMYQPNYNNAYRTALNPTPGMENYDNSYDNSTEFGHLRRQVRQFRRKFWKLKQRFIFRRRKFCTGQFRQKAKRFQNCQKNAAFPYNRFFAVRYFPGFHD